jgi:hypothetical protein
MDGQFITNKEQILSDIINSILPKCDNAYFLVGYFYFSGFAELCDKLKSVNLKILVGLEVERSIVNSIKEVEISQEEDKEIEFYELKRDLLANKVINYYMEKLSINKDDLDSILLKAEVEQKKDFYKRQAQVFSDFSSEKIKERDEWIDKMNGHLSDLREINQKTLSKMENDFETQKNEMINKHKKDKISLFE